MYLMLFNLLVTSLHPFDVGEYGDGDGDGDFKTTLVLWDFIDWPGHDMTKISS